MRLAAVLLLAALGGCAATPFQLGEPVPAPPGCVDLRARGGQC